MADDRTPSLTLRLSPTTKALVATACRERQVNASELVEAALVAFLSAEATSVQHRLASIEKSIGTVVRMLETQSPPAKPTVASYDQLYPTLTTPETIPLEKDVDTAAALDALPPQPGGWRRLFPRRAAP